jgi:hypothetical protein
MSSGLYDVLTERGLLVKHSELDPTHVPEGAYKVIAPELVPLITYPYEWSFSQLQDAALATLEIQKLALAHGMSLRDASAYNLQFMSGRPIMIDTLSFGHYKSGQPWEAYRQFCQHFVAPLALMSTRDLALSSLLQSHLDGIPLSLASTLLPQRSKLHMGLSVHLTLHARLQRQNESSGTGATGAAQKDVRSRRVSQNAVAGIVDSLERTVKSLKPKATKTEWGRYYQDTNYTDVSFEHKKVVVAQYLDQVMPKRVLDLGANNGLFSRLASDKGIFTISSDIDPLAVEINYLETKIKGETNLQPLLIDLTNPSPAIGWANTERQTFTQRAGTDVVMALALIHHLAIGSNVPFDKIASYMAELGPHLIIEFVPKTDSQVKRLLVSRQDIFHDYSEKSFEKAFTTHYSIVDKVLLKTPARILYLLKRKA